MKISKYIQWKTHVHLIFLSGIRKFFESSVGVLSQLCQDVIQKNQEKIRNS